MGQRMQRLWNLHWWKPTQAHNGYLETYLNQGLLGVTVLAIVLFGTFWSIRHALLTDFKVGRLRLAYFVAILLYNYSDYTFTAPHLIYFVFFLIAMEYRPAAAASVSLPHSVLQGNRGQPARLVAARSPATPIALRGLK
jgi:O-antigen ligase